MMTYPKTLCQARKLMYGRLMMTHPYRDGYCAYEVWPNERGPVPHQCLRLNGHGPAALYCKQHAKEVERHD